MSFVVHIWEYPAPQDSAEAELILETLEGERGPQNPRFIQLARALTAEYPCITTLDDAEAQERGVWTDGPLDGVTDSGVYGLGILSQHIDSVFPFVCDKANELGLNAYEMVNGSIHRADGTVLEHDFDAGKARLSSTGLDLTRLAGLMVAQLAPLAAGLGFRRVGYGLVRGIEGGWQALAAELSEVEGQVTASVALKTCFYDVMRRVHAIDRARRAGDAGGMTFGLSTAEYHKAPVMVSGPDDFLPAMRTLASIVKERLMPAAEQGATLAGLDALMNGTAPFARPFPLNHLVVARLVGAEGDESVYGRLREQGHINATLEAWLSSNRSIIEAVVPSPRERGIQFSVGPKGGSSAVFGPGR